VGSLIPAQEQFPGHRQGGTVGDPGPLPVEGQEILEADDEMRNAIKVQVEGSPALLDPESPTGLSMPRLVCKKASLNRGAPNRSSEAPRTGNLHAGI
jgi:hypothetical protein